MPAHTATYKHSSSSHAKVPACSAQCPECRSTHETTVRRRDSVASIQRTLQLTMPLCEAGLERSRQNGRVPVLVVVEHCNYLKTPIKGRAVGNTIPELLRKVIVFDSFYAPRYSVFGTTFDQVDDAVRKVFDSRYGQNQSTTCNGGDILCEMYLRIPGGAEKAATKENWLHILDLLKCVRGPAPSATLVAKLTCVPVTRR